ncbi:MAG TPA: MmcB family DNA repair protein [Burkholderiaceae bacterium]|nr:MmcB family DNA repair protein [Burkholderiaceae bacterium]
MSDHNNLIDSLAEHLIGNKDIMVWRDMQLGPAGSPRPDIYTIDKTYTKVRATVYEIKASASDLRADITAGKWTDYLLYASSVTFAVPASMPQAAIDAVPRECGLIIFGPTGWRHRRKPTVHKLTEIPWQAWLKLLIDGTEREGAAHKIKHFSAWDAQRKIARRHGSEAARLLHNLHDLPARAEVAKARHKCLMEALDARYKYAATRMHEDHAKAMSEMSTEAVRIARILGVTHKTVTPADGATLLHDLAKTLDVSGRWDNVTQICSLAQAVAAQANNLHTLLTALRLEEEPQQGTATPRQPRTATHHSII